MEIYVLENVRDSALCMFDGYFHTYEAAQEVVATKAYPANYNIVTLYPNSMKIATQCVRPLKDS